MNFSYQPYDPPDNQRDQVLGAATLPESDVLAQDASDAFFGMEREAGAFIASKVASTPMAALRGPGQDEYIDAHTLNQDYGQSLGLSFDKPMRRAQADILVQQKRDQLSRDYTLSHAPGGFWNGTARLGTQLAVSAVDPMNVAAAFVPVVGETRAGLWAQKVGTTTARVAEGGIEGAAGMAALQPVQYAYSNEFEQEYGPMEAFMNVAFGSLLGGGLHAGLGKMSDMLGGLHPETREAALRGSVAQFAEGRPVDAAAAIASDSTLASAASPDARLPETAAPGVAAPPEPLDVPFAESDLEYQSALDAVKESRGPQPNDQTILQAIGSHGGLRTRNGKGELTPQGGDLMSIIGDNPGHVMNIVNNTSGLHSGKVKGSAADTMTEILKSEGWLHPDAGVNDLHEAIAKQVGGEKVYHPGSEAHVTVAYRKLLDRELDEAGVASTDTHGEAAQKLAQFREFQAKDFASKEYRPLAGEEDQLLGLHGHEDWIGSDEWLRQEQLQLAGVEQEAAAGNGAAGRIGRPESAGLGDGTAAPRTQAGIDQVSATDDALNRARTAQNDFTQNRAPSTLVPPGVSEAAARDVASGKGDNIDEEIEAAESTLKDFHRNGVISDDDLAAMKEANAADLEAAKTQGEAAKAASTCLFLHP